MFIYFGKNFKAASAGAAIIGVQCEKCACEYYYELARIGTGAGTAPYAIGSGIAERAANERAGKDLQVRLQSEAELVPCPKCHWVNDHLIRGYRRSRYRGLASFASVVGILGVATSFLLAWVFSKGDPRDQYLTPYFLYGGPGLVVVSVAALIGLQAWLRQRIDPNVAFPQPPVVPPGTPTALFGDPAKEAFWPAAPGASVGEWQEFQIGRNRFPLVCCDCLQSGTTEHAVRIDLDEVTALEIPRCAKCAGKRESSPARAWLILASIVALVGGMTLTLMYVPNPWSSCASIGLLPVFFLVVVVIAATWKVPGPVEAKVVDSSRGVVRVRFRNPAYARLVAEQAAVEYAGEPPSTAPSTAIEEIPEPRIRPPKRASP